MKKKEVEEERKKKKVEEERKKDEIEIFAFDFLDCEEKPWDSGAIFDITVLIYQFCISSLCLSLSCSHALSTGRHLKPTQSLLKMYNRIPVYTEVRPNRPYPGSNFFPRMP